MAFYTFSYIVIATNQPLLTLGAALAAVPRDVASETLLGLTLVSDITTTATPNPNNVERTIKLHAGPNPLLGNPQTAKILTNLYTGSMRRALATLVYPTPVVVS